MVRWQAVCGTGHRRGAATWRVMQPGRQWDVGRANRHACHKAVAAFWYDVAHTVLAGFPECRASASRAASCGQLARPHWAEAGGQ
mmetsp:Transcript_66424/g.214077  ORF Transcript_66424/g.214077 Transcript_66424/m.214077 type:complete len:85 (-) Transcript_66424:393-647(-)